MVCFSSIDLACIADPTVVRPSISLTFCQEPDFINAGSISELPGNLKLIESQAFQDTKLQYIYVPDSCERIEAGAFTGTELEYVSAGSGTVIEAGAFDSSVVVEIR